jgi:branched-chain amino acid transport system permease protein
MTFAGLGAFAMGKVAGADSIVGLLAAAAFPAAVGAILAVVVLRLRGIYLALATLAFAYAMDSLFFNHLLGFGGILHVGRFAIHSQRSFVVEISLVFALVAVGVLALRRGQFGRRLAAINDSEVACASIGMNITLTKVLAFTMAAGIAGLGGALYGGWQRQVGPSDFVMLQSLMLLLLIMLGGVESVSGAFAAALFLSVLPVIESHTHIHNLTYLVIGLGALLLGRIPGGVAGMTAGVRERWRTLSARPRPTAPVREGVDVVGVPG